MADYHSRPDVDNYSLGKGVLSIALFSGGTPGTYSDVGNCTSFEYEPTVEKLAHYSSRSGTRVKDKEVTLQTEYTITFELDEMAVNNLALFLLGTTTGAKTHIVYALQNTEGEYALRFISDNPTGPNIKWNFWKCTLMPNGAMQLIGEEWMVMSMTATGLADTANHSESPYITAEYVTTTTTTTTTT